MEFTTGISPLTFKSIMKHNALCTLKVDDLMYDIKSLYPSDSSVNKVELSDLRVIVTATILIMSNWADERRELSNIGNRPAV